MEPSLNLGHSTMKKNLLLVDRDVSSQNQSVPLLISMGWTVSVAGSGIAALALLEGTKFDVALIDLRLASLDGCDLLSTLKRQEPGMALILMVDESRNVTLNQPLRLSGYLLLTKPLKIQELQRVLEGPAGEANQPTAQPSRSEAEPPSPGYAGLIGQSEKMKRVYHLISKVASQRHPVLILGESGTGKELVARAIHTQGLWRDRPFVPVDCGALPPTLIESELFGHLKGAFTGATQSRKGLLAAAGTGTVFLDEIGELPIELQSRLLRALQEHEIRPLGSNDRVRFEARIIAATNQDMEAAIKRGTFRRDLFYRLNVVSIKMPPLRDRKEEIPGLVRHFMERFANEELVREISDEVMGRLISYKWPGNVRELENCIQRAVSLGSGTFIQMHDLPSILLYHVARTSSSGQDLTTLQGLEQQAIRQALLVTKGDRVRAAKLLGIGKTTIYRKLKEYGLEHFDTPPPPSA
jgi:two-component system response regulator HydG